MDMTGEQRIAAPQERVYAALNDPEILRQCIPGCRAIERKSDTEMDGTVVLAVGPIKASFTGAIRLRDLDPPRGYTIVGEGKGGAAGFAKGQAKVELEPDGTATILRYQVRADVGGKLAQLGARLIDSTSRKLAGEFFQKFGVLAAAAPAEAAPAAAGAVAPAPAAVAPPPPAARPRWILPALAIGAVVVVEVIWWAA